MAERRDHAAHDGQAQAQPATGNPGIAGDGAAVKLFEHRLALIVRDAAAGVGDIDTDVSPRCRAPTRRRGAGVAQRVGEDVLQDPAQQRAVGADPA